MKKVTRLFSMVFYCLIIIVFTLFLYLSSYLPHFLTDKFYRPMARLWCRLFIKALGVDLRLYHKNKKPLPDHYILIGNHPSSMEDFGIPSLFDIHPLAKQGVQKWFFIGRIAERAGTIFFDRKDPDSRRSAVGAMVKAVNSRKNIVLFPEGGCRGKRIYDHFKTGAFDVSLQTGAPVVPVFLHYEAQDNFVWLDPDTLIDNMWNIMKTSNNRVNYYVYDALDPADFDDKIEYANYTHSLYLEWQKRYLD